MINTNSEELIVECAENCGNSPKKSLLKDLNIAFVKNEFDFWMSWMTDDVVWNVIGDKQIQGKNELEKTLYRMKKCHVQQISIHNIITHGNTASVNGTLLLHDQQKVEYCDVYNFRGFGKNSKIKSITSYVIK